MDLAGLVSCRDLTAEHADEAVRSLEKLRLLVARLTEIGEPEDGAPKVLILFARLARGDVDWLEGDVTVEITGNDLRTLVDVFKEEGWGIKERLITQARFRAPFDEFERAVEISAKRFKPLEVTRDPSAPGKIVLSTAANAAKPVAPPAVALDETSVGTAPPPPGFPEEPEPFHLPPPSEPEPFAPGPGDGEDAGFGAFIEPAEVDDPAFAAAVVSPKKTVPDPVATPRPTPVATPKPKPADPVHSRPTVRRMVAIKPEALRTGRKDPRREEDE